jgi:hypothetical protein
MTTPTMPMRMTMTKKATIITMAAAAAKESAAFY